MSDTEIDERDYPNPYVELRKKKAREYSKRYYDNNKDKFKKYNVDRVCECGREVKIYRMPLHLKTEFHNSRIKNMTQNKNDEITELSKKIDELKEMLENKK